MLNMINKSVDSITKEDLRTFLETCSNKYSIQTYNAFIKTIRRFFRDFKNKPELADFKFKTVPFIPKTNTISKENLRLFYDSIQHPIVKLMFHAYAVTGLRRNDIMFLRRSELDMDKRMIICNNGSRTKHRWITFYTEDLAKQLHPYLNSRADENPRVFPVDKWKTFPKYWNMAVAKTNIKITPKDLRDWFINEMLRLGVTESYVDCFVGHTPKSVLSRNYIIYNPEKLKIIYDNAHLNPFQ